MYGAQSDGSVELSLHGEECPEGRMRRRSANPIACHVRVVCEMSTPVTEPIGPDRHRIVSADSAEANRLDLFTVQKSSAVQNATRIAACESPFAASHAGAQMSPTHPVTPRVGLAVRRSTRKRPSVCVEIMVT